MAISVAWMYERAVARSLSGSMTRLEQAHVFLLAVASAIGIAVMDVGPGSAYADDPLPPPLHQVKYTPSPSSRSP